RHADLRWLAQGLVQPARLSAWLDAAMVAEGCGLARVETARGTLLHRIELDGERVASYRIVAPTEWNFHPRGAFVREITGRRVATRAEAELAARRLALSLDPCVSFAVAVDDA
ncbi:MAG: nickel-dependent hydrogenase large subunit, partial [Candidatus Accumulibacter sp.]|nr:nickel-dependent hydrogenase large subunit [Accumulibacter sp.]